MSGMIGNHHSANRASCSAHSQGEYRTYLSLVDKVGSICSQMASSKSTVTVPHDGNSTHHPCFITSAAGLLSG